MERRASAGRPPRRPERSPSAPTSGRSGGRDPWRSRWPSAATARAGARTRRRAARARARRRPRRARRCASSAVAARTGYAAASRGPTVGTSSGIAATSRKKAGNAGMSSRKKLPLAMLAPSELPFRAGTPRARCRGTRPWRPRCAACPTNPASGRNSSTRTLQKNSRSPSKFSCRCSQSIWIISPIPATREHRQPRRRHVQVRADRTGSSPRPRCFQIVSVSDRRQQRGAEREPFAPAPRDREGEERRKQEERVRRLQPDREPGRRARRARRPPTSSSSSARRTR